MLPYYSPFKVAEQFMMLEALFPNRIDLGVGRAPGGDMRTAQAVAAGDYNRGDIFPQQVADLRRTDATARCPTTTSRAACCCSRKSTRVPQLWMLGSSDFGGLLAAQLGIRFAFAHFINAHYGHRVARGVSRALHRRATKRNRISRPPSSSICADTDEEAAALEKAVDLRRVQMAYGLNDADPDRSSKALAQQYGERELNVIDAREERAASSARRSA